MLFCFYHYFEILMPLKLGFMGIPFIIRRTEIAIVTPCYAKKMLRFKYEIKHDSVLIHIFDF